MKYYAFVKENNLVGVGQARMLNKGIQNIEITEELFDECREDKDKYIYSNGEFVLNPEFEKKQQAQIQTQLTGAVQHVLDSKAQELLYDNCLSVCSYIDTGVPKFDAEGRAFRAWRSQVWAKGYEILAQVQSGERTIPTEEELIAELPELVIVYDEASAQS